MSTYSQPSFSSSTWKRGVVWMCKLGKISEERLKIKVQLLLTANRSYMPRRLAQQRMTLSDLEWLFHTSRAISAVATCSIARSKSCHRKHCIYFAKQVFFSVEFYTLYHCFRDVSLEVYWAVRTKNNLPRSLRRSALVMN